MQISNSQHSYPISNFLVLYEFRLYFDECYIDAVHLKPVPRDRPQLLQLFGLAPQSQLPVGELLHEGLKRDLRRLHHLNTIQIIRYAIVPKVR